MSLQFKCTKKCNRKINAIINLIFIYQLSIHFNANMKAKGQSNLGIEKRIITSFIRITKLIRKIFQETNVRVDLLSAIESDSRRIEWTIECEAKERDREKKATHWKWKQLIPLDGCCLLLHILSRNHFVWVTKSEYTIADLPLIYHRFIDICVYENLDSMDAKYECCVYLHISVRRCWSRA